VLLWSVIDPVAPEYEWNTIVIRNEVLLCRIIDPMTLTFNSKTIPLLVYPKVIPYSKFEHFGIIRSWVMLRTNKQTEKQTDSKILPMPTYIVGMCNNNNELILRKLN